MILFSMIILVFFAIIGLCSFITAVIDILCKSKHNAVLILRDLRQDSAEAEIRSAARICLRHTGIRLICIIDEDDPAYDICRLMQKDYPFMELSGNKE